MTSFGNISPDVLAERVNELDAKVGRTRREDLHLLIEEIEQFSRVIAEELRLDEAVLEREQEKFRKEFSIFDRVNPFATERKRSHEENVAPRRAEVREDRYLLTRCAQLLEWVRNASQPIEFRTHWHGGIFGVYNEHTGRTQWRECWHSGVAGVYHPDLREVVWRERWKHGVAGVFNPVSRQIEWREAWHSGVAGVFNPTTREVEWEQAWRHGVCGVYNPAIEAVEWREVWKQGVAGAYDAANERVVWHVQWHHGVACVYHDGETYRSSGSYYADEDHD